MISLRLSAIVLLGAGLIGSQAMGASFGTVTLKASETRMVDIATTARALRVCNDLFSTGPITVTIGGNVPHDLQPGRCTEETGDRMTIVSHATGQAMVDYRPIGDHPSRADMEDL
jgi:hypothetical protein